jgi:Kef-type K+ transport system membrane component KefB
VVDLNRVFDRARARVVLAVLLAIVLSYAPALAQEESGDTTHHWGKVFLMFALVLLAGRVGDLVQRFGQPPVIGQLVIGMVLAAIGYMGLDFMKEITQEPTISFLAAFGAALLLFSIGLESNLAEMRTVGVRALVVATIGVAVPFVLGTWVLGPIFFGDESTSARLFIGASLVATSIGITASVFRALNITRIRAAQTVLGAAVADDVFGLVILAVVAAVASGEEANARMVAELILKAFGFLAIAIIVGRLIADPVSRFFRGISGSDGMLLSVAVGFALVFGYLAELFGLEPIIGAFAAGLVLDGVHFLRYDEPLVVREIRNIRTSDETAFAQITGILDHRRHTQVEELVGTLNHVFVPVFFVYTGMLIDIESLLKPELYLTALIVSVVAILGKLVSGFAAAGTGTEKLLVGIAMVPRGEVGLIFAATGKGLGVLSDDLFSVIIITIVVSTLIAPPLVRIVANKLKAEEGTIVEEVPA